MKRFYVAMLLFMLPFFIFLGGAEYYVRSLPNIYKYKNGWMDEHAEEVETLILGSSHAMNGINPDFLGRNTYNLALSGQTVKYDNFLFFKWSERYKNLKVVLYTISFFSFFLDENFSGDPGKSHYLIYMDYPCTYDNYYNAIESLNFKEIHGKIHDYMYTGGLSCQENGFLGLCNPKEDKKEMDKKNELAIKQQTVNSFEYVNRNYSDIIEMAFYCKAHGIRMVLVSTPIQKPYSTKLNEEQNNLTQELVRKMQKQCHLDYLDYRNDERFGVDDFEDYSHLNVKGAKKFTKILNSDLLTK